MRRGAERVLFRAAGSSRPSTSLPSTEIWRVILHLTFVVSGVLFAVMDWIVDRRKTAVESHLQVMASEGAQSDKRGDGI